jgi:hypothetical protein
MVRASGCDNGLPVARAPYGVFETFTPFLLVFTGLFYFVGFCLTLLVRLAWLFLSGFLFLYFLFLFSFIHVLIFITNFEILNILNILNY